MKKIVIISSGQPSLNPRMVKEADALADAGYDVTVLYAYWNDWGTRFDKPLLLSKKWKAICVGGDPVSKPLIYFLSRLIHKLARSINQKTKGRLFADLSISRASFFLTREAKKHSADLYIGHNSGALPATVKAAKTNVKPCGFDAEDFHRFEVSDDKNDPDVTLKTNIENRYIPGLDYLTASSPLIAQKYKDFFPDKEPVIILNVFPRDLSVQQEQSNKNGPIRLFWFSQTIGPGRGIEDILDALLLLKKYPFELHLLGHLPTETQNSFINKELINVCIHEPLPPDEIIAFASQFDIGLAAEKSVPLNRDICLANKIFTYMQAGLVILASDTTAQLNLLNENEGIGRVYQKGNPQSIADGLLYYHQHRNELFKAKQASLSLAREKFNWEIEQQKFLTVVQEILK